MIQITVGTHQQLMDLSDGTFIDSEESEWIEDVIFNADTCNSKVVLYIIM